MLAPLVAGQTGDWVADRVRIGADSNACGITRPDLPLPRPVVLWLHGGMHAQLRTKGWEAHRQLTRFLTPSAYYLCSPSAYAEADWVSPEGLAHIEALLDYMAANYPRARLDSLIIVGVSDGGLGALRYAKFGKRKPIRTILFSVFPPLILEDKELFSEKAYLSTDWTIFQGGRDAQFPSTQVFPLLKRWSQVNPRVKLHLYPAGEHDFSWFAAHAEEEIRHLF